MLRSWRRFSRCGNGGRIHDGHACRLLILEALFLLGQVQRIRVCPGIFEKRTNILVSHDLEISLSTENLATWPGRNLRPPATVHVGTATTSFATNRFKQP